jgi:16S rRNA (uracil1498-N3)-methyltransferase
MNFLVLSQSESRGGDIFELSPPRVKQIIDEYPFRIDGELFVVCSGEYRGRARILELKEYIRLQVVEKFSPVIRPALEVIVGVSRPQTMKKVLHAATSFGVAQLHLVPSERGEKSYLQSKTLEAGAIEDEITLGMAQSGTVVSPQVTLYRSFWDAKKILLSPSYIGTSLALLGDTTSSHEMSFVDSSHYRSKIILAIGPESGWSSRERECFLSSGFKTASLGEGVHRVEVALAGFLGFIEIMRRGCNSMV